MYLKIILKAILILFCLAGCGNNKLSYIQNDNYNKNYYYYLQSFKINSCNYELKSIFDNETSYINTKNLISLMKKKYVNKHNIYIVLLCPATKNNSHDINIFFDYIKDLYSFLKAERTFNNQIYTLGMPSPDLNKYTALVYFVSI